MENAIQKIKRSLLVRFILYAAPLFLIWTFLGTYYVSAIAYINQIMLKFAGLSSYFDNGTLYIMLKILRLEIEFGKAHLIDFNITPVFALILAAKSSARKKLISSISSFPAILLLHSFMLFAKVQSIIMQSPTLSIISNSGVILNPLIPFVIWFLISDDSNLP